jgi:hypothetical protein
MIPLNDLAKYDHDFHVGHKLWTESVRALMLEHGTLANGEKFTVERGFHYGGGLKVGDWRGQQWASHSGSAKGFSNYYSLLPALKFSVAVFCNRGEAHPGPLTDEVVDVYRGGDLNGCLQPGGCRFADSLIGRFRSEELDAEYAFTREGEGLKLTITSAYTSKPLFVVLEAVSYPGGDVLKLPTGSMRLEYGADGRVSAFTTLGEELAGIRFVRI